MKLSAMVGLAILISPIALAAQGGGVSFGVAGSMPERGTQSTMLTIQPQAAGCPVSLRAQHKADGSMEQVGTARLLGIGQWLHLTLTDRNPSPPVSALVTVHGFSNKARVTQAGSGDGADTMKTLTVTFKALEDKSSAGELWAPGMTAVTRIDLGSVTYADGTVRTFTAQQACRVVPDSFMLVAGR